MYKTSTNLNYLLDQTFENSTRFTHQNDQNFSLIRLSEINYFSICIYILNIIPKR